MARGSSGSRPSCSWGIFALRQSLPLWADGLNQRICNRFLLYFRLFFRYGVACEQNLAFAESAALGLSGVPQNVAYGFSSSPLARV